MASRPREVTEEELRAGIPPFEWVLDLSSKPLPLPMGRAMSYTFFLQRAEHVGVLDPRQAQALGYGGPNTSRLTLFAAEPPGAQAPPVEPLVLHFLPPLEDGSVPVVNPTSNAVYRVSAETASALLTTRKELFDKDAPNPWDAALKAMGYGGH